MGRLREASLARRLGSDGAVHPAVAALRRSSRVRESLSKLKRSNPPPEKPSNTVRLCLAGGIAVFPVGTGTILFAIESTKHFAWTGQNISSLLNGPEGLVVSAGMVASGLLATTFTYGLRESLPRRSIPYDIGAGLFAITGVALVGAGIIHPPGAAHYSLAGTYFLGSAATQSVIGADMVSKGSKALGGFGLGTAAVALAAVATGFIENHHVPAIYEFIGSISTGTWMLVTSASALVRKRLGVPIGKKQEPIR
jgi:hypothetical membrane protein